MSDLIDTTEMYLRTILDLEEEGIIPLRARIAERLEHSGPTVSQTVARLERDGLLVLTESRQLELTQEGRARAVHVMRKHRLAERLLSDVIGLEWPYIHEEACRWEHVMSERVERRLMDLLENPVESPYGNPIPGLEELGFSGASPQQDLPTSTMREAAEKYDGDPAPPMWRVARLAESIQVLPEVLDQLMEVGLLPGREVQVRGLSGAYTVLSVTEDSGESVEVELPLEVAQHIAVTQQG